jgi:hypothetical protein
VQQQQQQQQQQQHTQHTQHGADVQDKLECIAPRGQLQLSLAQLLDSVLYGMLVTGKRVLLLAQLAGSVFGGILKRCSGVQSLLVSAGGCVG